MHRITENELMAALDEPDFTEPSVDGRTNAWKTTGDTFLRVTYKNEASRMFVITAVRKRKGWR